MLEEATFAGSWPAGLDPATNTNGGANLTQNQAIFGGLFLLRANDDGTAAEVVPNQAKSGTLGDLFAVFPDLPRPRRPLSHKVKRPAPSERQRVEGRPPRR